MKTEPVTFHIGMPKTGTTYLQDLLWRNRGALGRDGLHYPGDTPGAHWLAALDLRGSDWARVRGTWDALIADVMNDDRHALVSHEMLAGLTRDAAARLLSAVHPRPVEIIITVRDLSRIVPATWQERAKNRKVETWHAFVADVSQGPAGGHPFWNLQDTAAVLRMWADLIPADRISVVTVPPPRAEPGLLLRRFAAAAGFDPTACTVPPRRANESIGAHEVALLQHVNRAAHDSLDGNTYRHAIKRYLVKEVLATRPHRNRVALSTDDADWVEAYTETIKATVRTAGCRVVGDLDDLGPSVLADSRDPRAITRPETISQSEVLDVSADLLITLAQEVVMLRSELDAPRPMRTALSDIVRGAARKLRRLRSA